MRRPSEGSKTDQGGYNLNVDDIVLMAASKKNRQESIKLAKWNEQKGLLAILKQNLGSSEREMEKGVSFEMET